MPSDMTPSAPTALDLRPAIEAAAALGKDGVEVLERLQAIRREEMDRAARMEGIRALIQAKSEFPTIRKTEAGPHTTRKGGVTKGNFAPIDEISAAVDPALQAHGFVYDWDRETVDGTRYIVCILTHESGWEKRARFPDLVDEGRGRSQIQSVASGESYAKRYSLIAVLGITTADPRDDDGEEAGRAATITDTQAADMLALIEEVGADESKVLEFGGCAKVEDYPVSRFRRAMKALEAKR